MKYKAILFDLDHTLLDTEQNNIDALEEIYYAFSFDNHYETFTDFYNVYLPYNLDLWRKYEQKQVTKEEMMNLRFYLPFQHINGLSSQKGLEINNNYLSRVSRKGKVIDGAVEILESLKPYYTLYILSNGFTEVQYKKMDAAGFTPYFDEVILSDHIGINKPDPAFFTYALDRTGKKAADTVMIGDNWNTDIVGAKHAGIDQIWFNPHDEKSEGFEPTYTVRQLTELKDILL